MRNEDECSTCANLGVLVWDCDHSVGEDETGKYLDRVFSQRDQFRVFQTKQTNTQIKQGEEQLKETSNININP